MPSSIVFPYGITLKEDATIDTVPVAEIGFKNKEGEWLSLFLVIDSGAAISALPKSDAAVFGTDVRTGEQMVISGIGGEKSMGWRHQIRIRIGYEILKIDY